MHLINGVTKSCEQTYKPHTNLAFGRLHRKGHGSMSCISYTILYEIIKNRYIPRSYKLYGRKEIANLTKVSLYHLLQLDLSTSCSSMNRAVLNLENPVTFTACVSIISIYILYTIM